MISQSHLQAANSEKFICFTKENQIRTAIQNSYEKIAPFWPLKNLIATNPLHGFKKYPFKIALEESKRLFDINDLSSDFKKLNEESIHWLQIYLDEGQALLEMPNKELGLFGAFINLLKYDKRVKNRLKDYPWLFDLFLKGSKDRMLWLIGSLEALKCPHEQYESLFTILLTSLPGFSSFIKYKADWEQAHFQHPFFSYLEDYIALRILLALIFMPSILSYVNNIRKKEVENGVEQDLNTLIASEQDYQINLLKCLDPAFKTEKKIPLVQMVFCIDVRSEPIRKILENSGLIETFGFAGFFGVPIQVHDNVKKHPYASCPVLLKPRFKMELKEKIKRFSLAHLLNKSGISKKNYEAVKYNLVGPFALAEACGIPSLAFMIAKLFKPYLHKRACLLKQKISSQCREHQIPLSEMKEIAYNVLMMMGLTQNFAPLVVLCGHGSHVENNAYASSLDCGACGGRKGGNNAWVLASILNHVEVRQHLEQKGIQIPASTQFIGAEHNTTLQQIQLKVDSYDHLPKEAMKELQKALLRVDHHFSHKQCRNIKAFDWSETRPEWGLAGNAAFVVAPRDLTKDIDLVSRVFLHSYDWSIDQDGKFLETIMTAPLIVGQWINAQYLFATLNNKIFGGGSKTTKNIYGTIGFMQGNASDLMHGLPMQSLYSDHETAYHTAQRLLVIIDAPRDRVSAIIAKHLELHNLFTNHWLHLIARDPIEEAFFQFQKEGSWKRI